MNKLFKVLLVAVAALTIGDAAAMNNKKWCKKQLEAIEDVQNKYFVDKYLELGEKREKYENKELDYTNRQSEENLSEDELERLADRAWEYANKQEKNKQKQECLEKCEQECAQILRSLKIKLDDNNMSQVLPFISKHACKITGMSVGAVLLFLGLMSLIVTPTQEVPNFIGWALVLAGLSALGLGNLDTVLDKYNK